MKVMYLEDSFLQMTTPGCNDILVFEAGTNRDIGQTAGIAHFGFRLKEAADIEEMEHNIKNAGGNIIEKGEFVPGAPYLFFRDPDNYVVEAWYELLK